MQEPDSYVLRILAITTIIILLFILFIFLVLVLYKKKQAKIRKDLQIIELNHEKSLLGMQLEIQEITFKKISQEIHDNISLTLTLAKLNLNTLDYVHLQTSKSSVENSVDLISKALNDLNDISKSLDSELIKTHGLIHAIEAELTIFSKTGKFVTNFNVKGDVIFLNSEKELILYRIVQEACNNILKHSYATHVNLVLEYSQQTLSMTVTDNGVGFEVESLKTRDIRTSGLGLNNIRNRAKMINACVNIESVPGEGTTIHLKMPLEKKNVQHETEN